MAPILIFLQKIRRSYRLFLILTAGVLNAFPLEAQKASDPPKVIGRSLYDKLVKAQKEYEDAMVKGDSLEVAEMCYRLGKRYTGLGDFETAQKYFIRSLRIREPLGSSEAEAVGKTYLFMSHSLVEQKKYIEVMQTIRKAMANFKAAGSKHGLISGYTSMAGAHTLGYELNRETPGVYPPYSLDSAIYYFNQAEKLALMLNVPIDIANIYLIKGTLLLKVTPQLGLAYLKKADSIFTKEKTPYPIINTSLNLADACLILQQPVGAKKWLSRAQYVMDTARQGDFQQRGKLFQIYTRLYEQTGHWQEALKTQKTYYDLTVEALQADREGAITRLNIEYETQKKEAQLNWQRRLNGIVIGVCILAIIASIFFYRFFRRYQRLSQENEALVMEQSHRVKNNFQQLANLMTLQSNRLTNEDAQKAITEGLLRVEVMALVHQRLYYRNQQLVKINLENFIPELVEGVLYGYSYAHIQPIYTLEPVWLHPDKAMSLGLIINELVTNSCKYAFPVQPASRLIVTCQRSDHTINVEIEDNGPGFDAGKSYESFGLKLIQAFTQRLHGKACHAAGGKIFRLSFPVYDSPSIHLHS
ncbi:histidine kinase dimerization/phosphoacceptor domain -containing protein [Spirosoma sp. SC4-14]|uniref:histidine kinase dimerization/phosphoacceptor domain -containing protein n=1 Tax=Spirosoma sp. SC4-14 TaxID=3128900 RepID=UPI0030CF616B